MSETNLITREEAKEMVAEALGMAANGGKGKVALGNTYWSKVIYDDPHTAPIVYEEGTHTFWEYDSGVFVPRTVEQMAHTVRNFVYRKQSSTKLTMAGYEDIAKQMTGEGLRVSSLRDKLLCFDDVLLDPDTGETCPIPTLMEMRDLFKATKKIDDLKISTVRIPCRYADLKDAEGENFDGYISSICVDESLRFDQKMHDLMQEMTGYCLTGDAKRQVSFVMTGDGRNGKGVYAEILTALVGEMRVGASSLKDLTTDNFAMAELEGKRVNIADEASNNTGHAVEIFKKLVAGDRQRGRRMHEHGHYFKPRLKLFVMLNGVLTFDSWDYAVRERIVPVRFFRRFEADERDYDLAEKITRNEMARVAAWALEGLARLKKNNWKFTVPDASEEYLLSMEDSSSSTSEFFHELYEKSERMVPFHEVYQHYVVWCRDTGRKSTSRIRFSREIISICGKHGHIAVTDPLTKKRTTVMGCHSRLKTSDNALELIPAKQ